MTDELTPRQSQFLKNYLDPKSKTFSNAYQSAIQAGFTEDYAKTILSKDLDWLSENVRDNKLVVKALKNLDNLLGGEDDKIKADLTKFTLSRLNREKFGDRVDLTTGGKELPQPIISLDNAILRNNSNEKDNSIEQEN